MARGRKRSLTNEQLDQMFKDALDPIGSRMLMEPSHYIKPHPNKFQCFGCGIATDGPRMLDSHYMDNPGHAPTKAERVARIRYQSKAKHNRYRKQIARAAKARAKNNGKSDAVKLVELAFKPNPAIVDQVLIPQTVDRAVAGNDFVILFPPGSVPVVITVSGNVERGI